MTNLICSVVVALVTNVTEKFPQRMESLPGPVGPNGEQYALHVFRWVDVPNPTSKTVVTECKEVQTLRFEWLGEVREVKSEKLLWSTNHEFVLNKVWKAAK